MQKKPELLKNNKNSKIANFKKIFYYNQFAIIIY